MTSTSRGRDGAAITQRNDRGEGQGRRRRRSRNGRPPRDWDREDDNQPPIDPDVPPINIAELDRFSREMLIEFATEKFEIENAGGMPRNELIYRMLHRQAERNGSIHSEGVINIVDDGFGFLRGESLRPGPNDVYVSQSQIRRFGLRSGDYINGQIRQPRDSEKYYGLLLNF